MADTKISELPVATAIASPDVAPIVQGGVTKQADVSLFGSVLSANTARVDTSGNDAAGTIGNLSKPFLTLQAAVNAAAALDPAPDYVAIDVGLNSFSEDIAISFFSPKIVFTGVSPGVSQPFNSLLLGSPDSPFEIFFNNCSVGAITQTGVTQMTIGLFTSILSGDITGDHIYIKAYAGSLANHIQIIGNGAASIGVGGLGWDTVNEDAFDFNHRFDIIGDTGTVVVLDKSIVRDVTCSELDLSDSVVLRNLTADTVIYSNFFFDPSRFNFSTLPTSEPSTAGSAWIDTTGGLNIIKVHL